MNIYNVFVASLFVIGCSSSNNDNTCKDNDAEYVIHCSENPGGTCGSLAERNYNSVSATDAEPNTQHCETIGKVGCTETATNCNSKMVNSQGYECEVMESYSTTFESDGSSAKSITTFAVSCSNGSKCKSTYNCFFTRK